MVLQVIERSHRGEVYREVKCVQCPLFGGSFNKLTVMCDAATLNNLYNITSLPLPDELCCLYCYYYSSAHNLLRMTPYVHILQYSVTQKRFHYYYLQFLLAKLKLSLLQHKLLYWLDFIISFFFQCLNGVPQLLLIT